MRWLVAAAVIFLLAFALRAGLVVYAATTLAVVAAAGYWLSRGGLGPVSAERTVEPAEIEVGGTIEVRLTVTNGGARPLVWLLSEDLLPAEMLAERPPRVTIKGRRLRVRSLRGGAQAELGYRMTFHRRGVCPVGPLVLESGDLFGFYRRYKVVAPAAVVTVLPRVVPLRGFDVASRRPVGDVRLSHRLYEDPTRIAGVRPYQPGDPLNRIHWRATARSGRLHSKVYEPSSLAGATLLVDFHTAGYPARGEPFRSELVATTAASLTHALLTINQQVGLWCNARDATRAWVTSVMERVRRASNVELDEEQFQLAEESRAAAEAQNRVEGELIGVPTGRGWAKFHPIRLALARLEPADGRTFAQFVAEVTPRLPRDATALAVLPAVTVESAAALGELRRQGFAVAAVLVAPGEDELHGAIGRLATEGIRDVRVVENEDQLPDVCAAQVRPTVVALQL
jgi:uncharacterized protein (DUF58 family)